MVSYEVINQKETEGPHPSPERSARGRTTRWPQ